MCSFCNFINTIFTVDNFWSIAQTILWWVALIFSYIAWNQYKKDKQIEYYKLDYQMNKDIYDMYCNNPYIAKLIDIWDKESEDIPEAMKRVQNKMLKSATTLQLLLIESVNKGIKSSNKTDSIN